MLCAKLPQNVSKNRYRDISPCTWLHSFLFFLTFLLACVFKYIPTLNSCSSNHALFLSLSLLHLFSSWTLFCLYHWPLPFPLLFSAPLFFSLPLSADDATRVILKSTDDYINANYINVSLFLLILFFCFFSAVCLLLLLGVVGGQIC